MNKKNTVVWTFGFAQQFFCYLPTKNFKKILYLTAFCDKI